MVAVVVAVAVAVAVVVVADGQKLRGKASMFAIFFALMRITVFREDPEVTQALIPPSPGTIVRNAETVEGEDMAAAVEEEEIAGAVISKIGAAFEAVGINSCANSIVRLEKLDVARPK